MLIKDGGMVIDSETGVEYFLGHYGQMCPRFNRDGSLYCLTREEINLDTTRRDRTAPPDQSLPGP